VILANQANYLIHGFIAYVRDIFRSRRLILELTRREFRARHLGSAFGLLWAFIQPAVMLTIYCVIFYGPMYSAPLPGQPPFIVTLLSGLIPWFILSDLMMSGVGVITDNQFLVKKVVFRISLLPIVRLISHLPVHLFFVFVVTLIFWASGYPPTWYWLQLFYFLFAILVLGLGWCLLVSALVPFLRDLGQVVSVFMQIFFWLTPLVWQVQNIHRSKFVLSLLYLNPFFYIVEGYRDSMVNHRVFWLHPVATAYYWCFTGILLTIGAVVFARLQDHFADVL
jgi:ABC-type polysaccharide/polyol phosphate export permease